jgi:peptidoglycan-associated lipoprotein
MKKGNLGRILLVLLWVVAAGACAKRNIPPQQPGFGSEGGPGGMGSEGGRQGMGMDDARWRELGINSESQKQEFLQRAKQFENEDIFFDFDAYTLTDPAKKILDAKAEFIKRYPRVKVTIEGNCDERGTSEYNLALGERRAQSALQYLVNSGASQQQLGTVSYGKERPIDTGHDESSWARNRRDHFVLNY